MDKYLRFASQRINEGLKELLLLVLDISKSMSCKDWKPSRIAGLIAASWALIDAKAQRYGSDEVGVVAFSEEARLISPLVCLSANAAKLKHRLKTLQPDSRTNITAGLMMAGQMLSDAGSDKTGQGCPRGLRRLSNLFYRANALQPSGADRETHNRIILLSDGEHNTGPGPRKIAKKLKANNITINCVGIGGNPNELDERMMKAIASTGPDGKPCYCFIGDKDNLIREFKRLANRIRPA